MSTLTAPPLVDKLETEVPAVVQQARAIVVTDAATATEAGDFLRTVKTMLARVADAYDGIVEAAYKAHKTAVAKRNEFTDPLKLAEVDIKRKIRAYQMAEERKRRELEDRLRREEEERVAKENAERFKAEEDRRIREAQALQAEGRKAEAEELISAPVIVEAVQAAPIIVAPSAPKLEGVSSRPVWKFRIVNEALIPREYLMANEAMIGGTVRSHKDKTKIPGVEAYPDMSVSARSW